MPKMIHSLLVLLLALTACAPVVIPTTTQAPPLVTGEESALPQPEPTVIVNQVAEPMLTATAAEEPTETPVVQPELLPTVFDRLGYHQFAITRTYFLGLVEYFAEQNKSVVSMALSPDGNLLAVAGCWGNMDNNLSCETRNSGFLVIVDVNSGDLIANLPVEGSWPQRSDFSADSQQLLYSTRQQQVILWDIYAQKPTHQLNSLPRSTSRSNPSVAALPDGRGFAALIAKTLLVWDKDGKLLHELPTQQAATNSYLVYSLDGSTLLAYTAGGTVVEVFDTTQWKLLNRFETTRVFSATLSPDGHILAVLDGSTNSAIIWDLQTGSQLALVDLDSLGYSLHFNPKSDLLIITGLGNSATADDNAMIGTVIDTETWKPLGELYSFAGYGPLAFNRAGTLMMVFDSALPSLWELPDDTLLAGLEVVRQFQQALATGDFATAASLFDSTVYGAEYFASIGLYVDNLAGSFEQLCASGDIFCQPFRELVMMGHDWYDMVYMVRLEGGAGKAFTSPNGDQIIYLYVQADAAGTLRVTFPAMDY